MAKFTKAFLSKLIKSTKTSLNGMSEDEIADLIQFLNHEYHNKGSGVVDDSTYDVVIDYLKTKNKNHPILSHVGAVVDKNDSRKEELPFYMGSMDKIKADEAALSSFKAKYGPKFIISDKLDGVSALYYKRKGEEPKLYSRGDGVVGQNISHLIPFIKNIPKKQMSDEIVVRGELIISKESFEKVKDKGANARNMVAGLVNAKIPDLKLMKFVEFRAYALIVPDNLEVNDQFKKMMASGFSTAHFQVIDAKDIDIDNLSKVLVDRRSESPFEVDGIIVSDNKFYPIQKNKNPTYAFAFKSILTHETAEVTVTNVEWKVSKDGFFKPVVEITPVHLNGVIIKRATGFNGKFIESNKIGPGAKVLITRSGDVIPYILKTLAPASSGQGQMPTDPYIWSDSHVDILVSGESEEKDFKQLETFFTTIDIKGVSGKSVEKLFNAGLKDVKAVVKATSADFEKIQGLLNKSSFHEKLHKKLGELNCINLMHASNAFGRGFGEKRLELIMSKFPEIVNGKKIPSIEELLTLEGISNITAEAFIDGLKKYREFIAYTGLKCAFLEKDDSKKVKAKDALLLNEILVFTGFRDKELQELVENNGGTVSSSVTGKTTILVSKDNDSSSKKVQDAKAKGVKVITKDDLEKLLSK